MTVAIERAALLFDQGRFDLAEREARNALANDPNDAHAHAVLSLTLSKLTRYQDAVVEATSSIARAPDLPVAHAAHAIALASLRQWRAAREAAYEAVRLDPNDAGYYGLVADVELAVGKWADAYEAVSRGLAVAPEDDALLRRRTTAAAHLGLQGEAAIASSAALRNSPNEAPTLASDAYRLMHAGRFPEAQRLFREALRLDPTNQLAQGGYGETLKAHNVVYRVMLRYYLWTHRLAMVPHFLLLLAGPIAIVALRLMYGSRFEVGWLVGLIGAVSVLLIVTGWLAPPISNMGLRYPVKLAVLRKEGQVKVAILGGIVTLVLIGIVLAAAGEAAGIVIVVAASLGVAWAVASALAARGLRGR